MSASSESALDPALQALCDELADLARPLGVDFTLIEPNEDRIPLAVHRDCDKSILQRFKFFRGTWKPPLVPDLAWVVFCALVEDPLLRSCLENVGEVSALVADDDAVEDTDEGGKRNAEDVIADILNFLLKDTAAIKSGDISFALLRRFRFLHPLPTPKTNVNTKDQTVREAWKEEFRGYHHRALYDTIQAMRNTSDSDRNPGTLVNPHYSNVLPIIQSSGMGKSRVVRETAALMFTLPLNALDAKQKHTVYPEADSGVLDYFQDARYAYLAARQVLEPERGAQASCMTFLHVFFELTTQEVEKNFVEYSFNDYEAFAIGWREHLEADSGRNKKSLYDSVGETALKRFKQWLSSCVSEEGTSGSPPQPQGTGALQALLDVIKSRISRGSKLPSICILIALDEAGALSDLDPLTEGVTKSMDYRVTVQDSKIRTADSHAEVQTTRNFYDEFLSGFVTVGTNQPIALVTLSTQSHLAKHARPLTMHWSERASNAKESQQAPYTEFPFDVHHEGEPIFRCGQHTFDEVSSTNFMCMLGRPLWSALLNAAKRLRLDTPQKTMASLAFSKLTGFSDENSFKSSFSSPDYATRVFHAHLAALGTRLQFQVDVGRESARQAVLDLVTHNMRVVFNVPQHREYMTTGEPSEPLLAEAACACMNVGGVDLIKTLGSALDIGLIEKGARGELVARLLLVQAFDAAVRCQSGSADSIHWNTPVPVVSFLEALFHPDHHATVLDAIPDNVPEKNKTRSRPLREAFKDARLRLTHWGKFGYHNPIDAYSGLASCVRGMGIWGCSNQADVDFAIPIVVGGANTTLTPEVVSFILVQVKNRDRTSGLYTIAGEDNKHLELFPPGLDASAPKLPYMTIIMELGLESTKDRTGEFKQSEVPQSQLGQRAVKDSVSSLSPNHWQSIPAHKHARYSLTVHGCSERIYRVIPDSGARNAYTGLLAKRDIFNEHLRANNLDLLQRMKPLWDREGAFYDWTDIAPLF